uniref:Uncharacterized protein n=1 Tax=Rhizophora mucronata TaxID=61149 RepID=A0A2P2IH09_RHIMU
MTIFTDTKNQQRLCNTPTKANTAINIRPSLQSTIFIIVSFIQNKHSIFRMDQRWVVSVGNKVHTILRSGPHDPVFHSKMSICLAKFRKIWLLGFHVQPQLQTINYRIISSSNFEASQRIAQVKGFLHTQFEPLLIILLSSDHRPPETRTN